LADLVPIQPGQGSGEEQLTALVLNGVTSEHSRRADATGLEQFFAWLGTQPPQPFSKALLQQYRSWLLELNLSPATVNLRLSPLRKLAREMADNGLLDPALASGIEKTKGVKQQGVRVANWLLRDQANELVNAPDPSTLSAEVATPRENARQSQPGSRGNGSTRAATSHLKIGQACWGVPQRKRTVT
jgi:integrase/recombinase XerD